MWLRRISSVAAVVTVRAAHVETMTVSVALSLTVRSVIIALVRIAVLPSVNTVVAMARAWNAQEMNTVGTANNVLVMSVYMTVCIAIPPGTVPTLAIALIAVPKKITISVMSHEKRTINALVVRSISSIPARHFT